jgi:threonine/homoserine/homoserine lactone efflux protein
MLALEAIAVLGTIYLFFMYATIRATRSAEREKEERKVRRPSTQRQTPAVSTRGSAEQPRPA